MFSKIKKLFQRNLQKSESITNLSDALEWVKACRKKGDYNTAIIAAKELILKSQTSITYYENAIWKMMVLENSNIQTISVAAKEKHKKINAIIINLYKKINNIEKLSFQIEKEYLNKKHKEEEIEKKIKFNANIQKYKKLLKEKDYSEALLLAKKMVSDFPIEKESFKMLAKAQKLFNFSKSKDTGKEKEEKLKNILQEVGVEMVDLKGKKNASFFETISFFIKTFKHKNLEKKENLKRQAALNNIEKLLIKSGTIENISDEYSDGKFFTAIQTGLIKNVSNFSIHGFDFFGKIHGKDEIVGDTFGYYKEENKTLFYIGDATGHWVQAWFTVAILSKIFFEFSRKIKSFWELFVTINNELKQKLKGKIFVTSIFFELDNINNKLSFIWWGHDPMLLYRRQTNSIEKIIPWWLALGVRLIPNISSVKIKDINMMDGDVLFGYTDGIIEAKDASNEMYGFSRMEKSFKLHAHKYEHNPEKIYKMILWDVDAFRWKIPFEDDVSFFIFVRNTKKERISNKKELELLMQEMDFKKVGNKDIDFKNKTKQEIIDTLKQERHERELKIRLDRLDHLYQMEEFTKIKQEVYIYFREWYVHEKMRFYLEKSLELEQKSLMKKQDEKLKKKYEMLQELYKKGEYELVMKETLDILFKNGKI